jgi:hypothetical protein
MLKQHCFFSKVHLDPRPDGPCQVGVLRQLPPRLDLASTLSGADKISAPPTWTQLRRDRGSIIANPAQLGPEVRAPSSMSLL